MKIEVHERGLLLVPDSAEECAKLVSLVDTYEREGCEITFGSLQEEGKSVEGIFVTVGIESIKNVLGLMNTKAAKEFQIITRGDHSQN